MIKYSIGVGKLTPCYRQHSKWQQINRESETQIPHMTDQNFLRKYSPEYPTDKNPPLCFSKEYLFNVVNDFHIFGKIGSYSKILRKMYEYKNFLSTLSLS